MRQGVADLDARAALADALEALQDQIELNSNSKGPPQQVMPQTRDTAHFRLADNFHLG